MQPNADTVLIIYKLLLQLQEVFKMTITFRDASVYSFLYV